MYRLSVLLLRRDVPAKGVHSLDDTEDGQELHQQTLAVEVS